MCVCVHIRLGIGWSRITFIITSARLQNEANNEKKTVLSSIYGRIQSQYIVLMILVSEESRRERVRKKWQHHRAKKKHEPLGE